MGSFPNPDTQFKPGNPGGPGKPKGTRHISTWIQEMLNDEEFEVYLQHPTKGFVPFKGAPVKAIIQTATTRAVAGDDKAREWLAKYGWAQKLDIEASGNITINLVSYDNSDSS